MGNVKSFCCREDTLSDYDEQDERHRILYPTCGEFYNESNNSGSTNQDNLSYGSTNNYNDSKTYEQSALDRIYQRMAANLIDVAPGDSMVIQQAEYLERQKIYQTKLAQIRSSLSLRQGSRLPRHVDASANNLSSSPLAMFGANNIAGSSSSYLSPTANTGSFSAHQLGKTQDKRRVEYEPISDEDIQLITDISTRSSLAIKNLKIDYKEPVVTQFNP